MSRLHFSGIDITRFETTAVLRRNGPLEGTYGRDPFGRLYCNGNQAPHIQIRLTNDAEGNDLDKFGSLALKKAHIKSYVPHYKSEFSDAYGSFEPKSDVVDIGFDNVAKGMGFYEESQEPFITLRGLKEDGTWQELFATNSRDIWTRTIGSPVEQIEMSRQQAQLLSELLPRIADKVMDLQVTPPITAVTTQVQEWKEAMKVIMKHHLPVLKNLSGKLLETPG